MKMKRKDTQLLVENWRNLIRGVISENYDSEQQAMNLKNFRNDNRPGGANAIANGLMGNFSGLKATICLSDDKAGCVIIVEEGNNFFRIDQKQFGIIYDELSLYRRRMSNQKHPSFFEFYQGSESIRSCCPMIDSEEAMARLKECQAIESMI